MPFWEEFGRSSSSGRPGTARAGCQARGRGSAGRCWLALAAIFPSGLEGGSCWHRPPPSPRPCGHESDTGPGRICRGSLYRDPPCRAGSGDHCPRDQHRWHARLADHPHRHRGCSVRSHCRSAPGPGTSHLPERGHCSHLSQAHKEKNPPNPVCVEPGPSQCATTVGSVSHPPYARWRAGFVRSAAEPQNERDPRPITSSWKERSR